MCLGQFVYYADETKAALVPGLGEGVARPCRGCSHCRVLVGGRLGGDRKEGERRRELQKRPFGFFITKAFKEKNTTANKFMKRWMWSRSECKVLTKES